MNLRAATHDRTFERSLGWPGYLVAPDYLTRAGATFVAALPATREVMVDNGRFDEVGRISGQFAGQAQAVLGGLTDRTGRPVTAVDAVLSRLSSSSADALAELASQVADAVAGSGGGMTREAQLELEPTAVIGHEDILAACLLRLGFHVDLLARGRERLRARNRAVARAAVREARSLPGSGVRIHAVASAHDYDTAFDAGREFAAAGVEHAALGFGAYMADDSYVGSYKARGRRVALERRVPARYLRTALVAKGLWDGWAQVGGAPRSFHFLGLGAPIMVGIVAVAAVETPLLTFDATSPIRDAVEGTLYVDDPAPLKVRTRRVAQLMMDDPRYRWRCQCPFCRRFLAQAPFDLDAARAWRADHPQRAIAAGDLSGVAPLASALPLLAEPRGGPARKAVDVARMGHNHWVLRRIVSQVARQGSRDALLGHVDGVVAAYEASTSGAQFASAVRNALTLTVGSPWRPGPGV